GLADRKWRHMMDMAPRRLPVFAEPAWPAAPGVAARTSVPPASAPRPVSIAVANAAPHPQWQRIDELGSMGAVLRSPLAAPSIDAGQAAAAAPLVIEFETDGSAPVGIDIVALPTHPLTSEHQLRLGYQIDDGPLQVLDYRTQGRSEEWKRNVLSNTAVRSLPPQRFAPGKHRLQLYAMDPGFVLDRVDIVPEGAPRYYGAVHGTN
ncbi:MAG TPA: hypothetical protein VF616_02865, partial [Duganella sp.]